MTPREIEKGQLFYCKTHLCWLSEKACKRYSEYNPDACRGCPEAAKPLSFQIRRKNFTVGQSCGSSDLDLLDRQNEEITCKKKTFQVY